MWLLPEQAELAFRCKTSSTWVQASNSQRGGGRDDQPKNDFFCGSTGCENCDCGDVIARAGDGARAPQGRCSQGNRLRPTHGGHPHLRPRLRKPTNQLPANKVAQRLETATPADGAQPVVAATKTPTLTVPAGTKLLWCCTIR